MRKPGLIQLLRSVVVLAVLGSVAAAAAPVFWHLRGNYAGPAASAMDPAPAPVNPDVRAELADIGPILALAPFGAPVVEAAVDTPMGETTLDLVLLGVVVRSDPARSRGLIAQSGASGQFAPGDPINDRATLVEVAADHVVLRVDGLLETLSFPVRQDGPPTAAAPLTGTDRLLAAVTSQNADIPPETPQEYVDMWRERIRENPGEVLTAIGLIPTDQGYVIADQHDSGVRRAGLRAGDLVKTVNGQTVGDVEQDRDFYDDVAASGMATIEIERDGRTIVMSFPLQ